MTPNISHHFERRPGDYPRHKPPKYGWRDDNGKPIHEIDEEGNPICGRLSSLTGLPCKQSGTFLCPNGRCNSVGHGGRAPGAPIKHGRYSMFLPPRLATPYDDLTNEDITLNVKENIALIVAMIQDKLGDINDQSSAELWHEANKSYKAIRSAIIAQDETALYIALDSHAQVLTNGTGAQQKEREVLDLMSRAASLTKVEITRSEKMGQFMTAREMLANQAYVLSILKKHVEPTVLTAVAKELGVSAYLS